MEKKMTKHELLDYFAINAMTAQIEKYGITNPFVLGQTAYVLALEMMASRERVHREWKEEEEKQQQYANADLHELNLPARFHSCLMDQGIYTKKILCEWTERDICKIPCFGSRGRKYLQEAMVAAGLKLKDQK
jgi:DNA-directed RNA polymerase alpha subunit